MTAQDRRDAVLDAATKAFASGGYAGTSTDAVARAAGVSQPYVVRIFGTKLDLFLEVLSRACDRVKETFERTLDDGPFDPTSEADRERLGLAYTELMHDGDLLRVMMHGFTMGGAVPEIGALARERFGGIFAALRRTGWADDEIRDFMAHGMLLTVLMSMGALDADKQTVDVLGDGLAALVRSCIEG